MATRGSTVRILASGPIQRCAVCLGALVEVAGRTGRLIGREAVRNDFSVTGMASQAWPARSVAMVAAVVR